MVLWLKDCVKKKPIVLLNLPFRDRTLAYSGAEVQSRFYPGDLVTRTGDREIRSVFGRLPDYPGELACVGM